MTIAAETNKVTYNCDGSKTEFDFTFKVFQTSDIKVVLITVATDAETVLTETTHYAITGSLSSGGKVTTVSTYSSLYKIFITIDIDLDQETDLVYGGSYSSEAIETMADKLTKVAQQHDEEISRTIKFQIHSSESDIEIEDLVAGKTIIVNSAGDGLEMGESGGGGGGDGLDNIVEDTTPQLGGNLDMNGHSIGGNTESQLDDAVSKKHAENHNAASHSDITSTGADIDDAVGKKHTKLCETADFTKLDALGTASTRNAEDTLTDGSNLPDGAAIKTYGDTNWGGGGGGLTWELISTNTSAVNAHGYLINASGGNVTLTLPLTPSEGDLVGICDAYNKATTNTITLARNGKNIEGIAEDLIVDSDGVGFTLVYTDTTRGWEIVSEIAGGGGGGGGIESIVEDTTPQLGGNLDMNGHSVGGNTETQLDDAVSKKHTKLCETADFTKLDALGTASTRNAEDTMTNSSNLPDGAAIITYGDTNWGGGGGGGLDNVVEDTTPQLGGNLDMNGKSVGGNTEAQLDDAVSKKHIRNEDVALGTGAVAKNHLSASTDQIINVCYGTGSTPPTASGTTEGALYIQYVA